MSKRAVCVLALAIALTRAAGAAPDFEALGREVVTELSTGAFDKVIARFDEKMTAALPREKLEAAWDTVVDKMGAFKSVTTVRIREAPANKAYHLAELDCAFEQGPVGIRLAFNEEGKIAGLFFVPIKPPVAEWSPAPYVDPSTFAEAAVVVGGKLPGLLAMPTRQGPVPGVVLVHGSGPLDRDETIGPNKVFKDIAWGLASRGIAVLRYDKRSLVTPMNGGTVKDEVIDDAVAAVGMLAKDPKVDSKRIFVLGHSLGGMLAPRIAEASKDIDGLIVLAGTTRSLEDVVVDQIKYLKGEGTPEMAAAEKFAQRVRDPNLRADDTIDFMGTPMPAGYWLDLRAHHPEELAARIGKPILVLQGGRDYQVTMADFEGWKRTLGAKKNATLKVYPSMNHLFVAGDGRSMPDEYLRPGHVDPQVIDDIARWSNRTGD